MLRITAEVTPTSLTEGLRFHGETYSDKETVERIHEMELFLTTIIGRLNQLASRVEGRQEASAKDISRALSDMRENIVMNIGRFPVTFYRVETEIGGKNASAYFVCEGEAADYAYDCMETGGYDTVTCYRIETGEASSETLISRTHKEDGQ